ncbi:MAG TPA: peptidylprolyl isomerase, partial [Ktedonobacteraceae bacterium]|nr:peptidylprolyl isomerase [Ktedonobacteraceae bacterium]
MNSKTERPPRRPANARSAKTRSNKTNRYSRQTARGIEAKRDGKPLIFGWGKHLSHSDKMKVQRRSVWAFTGLIILVMVAVLVGSWINNNIIIPGLPITTVNSHQIPQSQFRKMVALKTLVEYNKLNGRNGLNAQHSSLETQNAAQLRTINSINATIASLNTRIAKLPKGPSAQRTDLNNQLKAQQTALATAQTKESSLASQINVLTTNTIPLEQQLFTESQIATDSATWLQDDELIREWLANQSAALQNKINPTAGAVQQALNALAANVPTTTTYNSLLSQMSVSDSDMHDMMTISLRRDNMQTYLASLIKSPAYQVNARSMTLATMANAQTMLKQLQANDATDFATLAKQKSQDNTSAPQGGNLGWLIRGQYAQNEGSGTVDDWLFDPQRFVGELSPILQENGTFRILQIMSIDPSRKIDATTLQTAQNNALSNWLLELKAEPTTHVSQPDSNMLLDPNNLPP